MMHTLWKVLRDREWQEFSQDGRCAGSAHDLRDGFIHLSTAAQVARTLEKHFANETLVMLIEIDPGALNDRLKWEATSAGALFPHLYGALTDRMIIRAVRLERGSEGFDISATIGARAS
jgi:uncharacterized protein (DUF952 family)